MRRTELTRIRAAQRTLIAVPYYGTCEPDTEPHGSRFSYQPRDSAMNAHGGKRPGAGRPTGAASRANEQVRQQPQPGSCRSPTCCGSCAIRASRSAGVTIWPRPPLRSAIRAFRRSSIRVRSRARRSFALPLFRQPPSRGRRNTCRVQTRSTDGGWRDSPTCSSSPCYHFPFVCRARLGVCPGVQPGRKRRSASPLARARSIPVATPSCTAAKSWAQRAKIIGDHAPDGVMHALADGAENRLQGRRGIR